MNVAQRTINLTAWVKRFIEVQNFSPIPGDASARRYFRVRTDEASLIAVDAPPQTEKNVAFVAVAKNMSQQGLRVPDVKQVDYDQGFLLLSDLGDTQLLSVLNEQNVQQHYAQAFEDLIKIQVCGPCPGYQLPIFEDSLIVEELNRFQDWYLDRHLGLTLSSSEQQLLQETYQLLISEALAQPQVFVHKDYHSRNLMLQDDGQLGILDFQDAVLGPLSYDLTSLLRDSYIQWPCGQVYQWVAEFWQLLPLQYRQNQSRNQFQQQFDWIGLQRHIKNLGIFARLFRRDSKDNYLKDIPTLLNYILKVSDRYPELRAFNNFLTTRVLSHESHDISGRARNATASVDG
jgi:aminoglycoside/choline kinase family phosphotransferase